MRREIYVCDHCGKEINDNNGWIGQNIVLPLIEWSDVDLCDDCIKKLCSDTKNFLKNRIPSYQDAKNLSYGRDNNE